MSWKEQAVILRMQVERVTSRSLRNDGSSALGLHFLDLVFYGDVSQSLEQCLPHSGKSQNSC